MQKRSEILKNSQFKVEDVFGQFLGKDGISSGHKTKLKKTIKKSDVNNTLNLKKKSFKRRKKEQKDFAQKDPPEFSKFR